MGLVAVVVVVVVAVGLVVGLVVGLRKTALARERSGLPEFQGYMRNRIYEEWAEHCLVVVATTDHCHYHYHYQY